MFLDIRPKADRSHAVEGKSQQLIGRHGVQFNAVVPDFEQGWIIVFQAFGHRAHQYNFASEFVFAHGTGHHID